MVGRLFHNQKDPNRYKRCPKMVYHGLGDLKSDCSNYWWIRPLALQSIHFKKGKYSLKRVRQWLKDHERSTDQIDVTANWIRARQIDPSLCGCYGFGKTPIEHGNIRFLWCSWPVGYEREYKKLAKRKLIKP